MKDRSHLLPEEDAVGTADAEEAHAHEILDESEERGAQAEVDGHPGVEPIERRTSEETT